MPDRYLPPCVAALLFIAACGGDTETPSAIDAAADTITAAALEQHVAWLADDARQGRLAGSPGYDAAAEYVAGRFAALGLEPAGDDGWYQQVPLVAFRVDENSTTMIVHRDGRDTELAWKEDYIMFGDKVREATSVRAEVVYVGFGVHAPELGYSDYAGVDVDGKIVAMFDNAPASFPHNQRAYYSSSRSKSREAVRRGAVGTISLRSAHIEEMYPWERAKRDAGTRPGMAWITLTGEAADYFPELRGAVLISADAGSELFSGTPISFAEARAATAASRPASTPLGFEVTLAQKTRIERISSPNVIGVVPGTDPALAGEYVVYSAHLDHNGIGAEVNGDRIYNGAYDNAMGVSLLLETARAFAAAPRRRSALFIAVTAEERGLLGSEYFAEYPTVPSDSMVANVNLDMPLFLYPVADIIAFGSEHSSLQATVAAAAQEEGFVQTPDPMPEENIFRRSDQYSFVRKGIPATFLVPGFSSSDPRVDGAALFRDHLKNHYHQPSDDMSRPFDWPSALRFARANFRIGAAIADDPARPSWNEGDFFGDMFARMPATPAPDDDQDAR
jgi:Peptidase family M28